MRRVRELYSSLSLAREASGDAAPLSLVRKRGASALSVPAVAQRGMAAASSEGPASSPPDSNRLQPTVCHTHTPAAHHWRGGPQRAQQLGAQRRPGGRLGHRRGAEDRRRCAWGGGGGAEGGGGQGRGPAAGGRQWRPATHTGPARWRGRAVILWSCAQGLVRRGFGRQGASFAVVFWCLVPGHPAFLQKTTQGQGRGAFLSQQCHGPRTRGDGLWTRSTKSMGQNLRAAGGVSLGLGQQRRAGARCVPPGRSLHGAPPLQLRLARAVHSALTVYLTHPAWIRTFALASSWGPTRTIAASLAYPALIHVLLPPPPIETQWRAFGPAGVAFGWQAAPRPAALRPFPQARHSAAR